MRRLIEEEKDKNVSSIIIFIDFRKDFDSINRYRMLKFLHAYRIPQYAVVMLLFKVYYAIIMLFLIIKVYYADIILLLLE